MRKNLFIILMVCLALVGLVSCTNEIEPAQDELIYVSFENRSSRALTATLENFSADEYYWSYEAKKNDGSGLKSGETGWDVTGEESVPVQEDKGLSTIDGELKTPTKVPGFSKGYWNFRLFAYKDENRQHLVYWGEADAVLIDSTHHSVSVTVSPISGGEGFLKVGTITFNPASSISDPTGLVVFNDVVSKYNESSEKWEPLSPQEYSYDSDTKTYTLDAKQYMFTRTYSYDGINVASGSVLVTVYSNLTTTVSGSLSELTSSAQFDAKQNPDAVNVSAEATGIKYNDSTKETTGYSLTVSGTETPKVTANISKNSVDTIMEFIKESDSAIDLSASTTNMTLTLGVDTTATTATSVVYEISMTATINYKETVGEQTTVDRTTTSDVKAVKEYVTATIQMQTGLLYVSVLHDGNLMADSTDTDEDEGYGIYSYDSSTGVLTIVTKTFSPFSVNFSFPEDEGVARIGNVYYNSLEDAVAAVPTNGVQTVIFMLKDTSLEAGVTIAAEQNVALELNGKTISGNTDSSTTYALITNRGTLTIQDLTDTEKNGTGTGLLTTYITNPDHQDVPGYASNTITNNGTLTVESGKIVNNGTGYACYAIDNQTNGNSYIPVLIINGGRFEQMNAQTYAIRMCCNSTTKTNSVTVNGGVITGGYGLWLQSTNANRNMASLTITGGLIEASDGFALFIGGIKSDRSATTVRISGGEISGTGVGFQGPLSGTYEEVSISDGIFAGVSAGSGVEQFITGGKFAADPRAYVAEGYGAFYDEDTDYWIVTPYNVIDLTTNAKYILATAGTNKGLLVDGNGDLVSIDTYKSNKLQLLDSSLSNVVADEIDNFNSDVDWVAVHPAGETENTTDFAGGYGTKIEPYWIKTLSQMQAISSYYNKDYAYFKLEDSGKTYDASDWTAVNINGSFNGNGAVFQGLDVQLFRSVGKAPSNDVYKIMKLTVNADIRIDGYGAALIRQAGNNLILEDVTVHGYIEGNNGAASFVCFGPGNITTASPENCEKMDWKFVRCISDATVYATGDVAVGFIKHPYSYASQQGGKAEAQASCLITIEDSIFNGTLYHVNNNSYAYKYFVGNANDVLVKTSYSAEFVSEYGNPEGTLYSAPGAKVEGKFFIGNYPGEGTKISGYGDYSCVVDRYLGEHYQINVTPGVLPEKYASFSIPKTEGAVSAKAVLEIAPNGPDGKGAYLGSFLVEDIELLSTQDAVQTTAVKYFDIDVNAEGVTAQGVSQDGKTYHVYSPTSYGTTYSSAGVRITQYASNGDVLSVTYFAFPKSN